MTTQIQNDQITRSRVFHPSPVRPTSVETRQQFKLPAELEQGFEREARFSMRVTRTRGEQAGDIISAAAQRFTEVATDKKAFHQLMQQVYGKGYDAKQAEQFRQRALQGDVSWMPPVRFVDAKTLNGGYGAFDAKSGVIFLNKELLGKPDLAAQVYAEELGHFLDTKLKTRDSAGDEGELFRRLLFGEKLSKADIHAIRTENDHGVIEVDGRKVAVEFWSLKKAIKKVTNTITGGAKKIAKGAAKVFTAPARGLSKAGSWLSSKTLKLFDQIFPVKAGRTPGWALYNAIRGVVRSPFEVSKSIFDNTDEGLKRLANGDFKGAWESFKRGTKDAIGKPIAAVVYGIGAVWNSIFDRRDGRKLTEEEKAHFRAIYGNSIDLDEVRVRIKATDNGRSNADRGSMVITIDPSALNSDGSINWHTFDHEMAHIWQFQNGTGNLFEDSFLNKFWKDKVEGKDPDSVYRWPHYMNKGDRFSDLNVEAQAELMADASPHVQHILNGGFVTLGGNGDYEYINATTNPSSADRALTEYLRNCIRQWQSGQGAP